MPRNIDITNQRFEKLVTIETYRDDKNRLLWKCKCDCGNICYKSYSDLHSGKVKSCGCLKKSMLIERNKNNYVNLIGQRFGRLTVIKKVKSINQHTGWECLCDCGNITIADSGALKSGDKVSCGCKKGSLIENKIANLLQQNNIIFKREYTFEDLKGIDGKTALRFDFALFDNQNNLTRLIEYNGEQHYSNKGDGVVWKDSLELRQKKDKLKREYCIINNIPLVILPYTIKNSITIDKILGKEYLIF